jgi:hypothetical protein
VMAGANFWDAPGHSMAGSNDPATRSQIFQWIEKNEKTLYSPRIPMHPVGVYFSPKSRDYDAGGFLPAFRGTLLLLLQAHREFQVVTPRTLEQFHGELLVLPNASVLSDAEKKSFERFLEKGGRLVLSGKETHGLCGTPQSSCTAASAPLLYFEELQHDFAAAIRKMPRDFLETLRVKGEIEIEAAPTVAANFGRVNGVAHIFLANFSGLVPGKIVAPSPQSGIRVRIPAGMGDTLAYLPFLGEIRILRGEKQRERIEFALPPLERGAVVWINGRN